MINFVKELATSTVAVAPSPATSGTSLTVETGHGSRFGSSYSIPFYLVAHPDNELPTEDNAEFLKVTAISGDTFTIVRGTMIGYTTPSAKSIAVGWRVSLPIVTTDFQRADATGFLMYDPTHSYSTGDAITTDTYGDYYLADCTSQDDAEVVGVVSYDDGDYCEVITSGVIDILGSFAGSGKILFLSSTPGELTQIEPTTVGHISKPVITILNDYGTGISGYVNIMRGMEIADDAAYNSVISDATPSGTVDSSNTAFSATTPYTAGTLEIFINGLKQIRNTDYTESNPTTGAFTMTTAPVTGDIIRVNYMTGIFGSGNADTVDGIHASTTPESGNLYPLNSNLQFPNNVIGTNEIGYAEVSTSQTGITALTDLTGLSVTVTVPTLTAGKKVIIEGWVPQIYSTVATDRADFAIREGSTGLAYAYNAAPSTGWGGATVKCRISPTAGSHTYKLSLARGVGSGSLVIYADSVTKAFIRVTVE